MPANQDSKNNKYKGLIQKLYQEKQESLEAAYELFNGDMRDSLGELSLIDNHPADIGTEVYQRERDIAQHDKLISRAKAIDAALNRWEEGAYGLCEHCGTNIPLERLELIPYTTVCTACSRKEEIEEQHSFYREPVEEEVIGTYGANFSGRKANAGFDGEDSWQAVARYGTSESPQDIGVNRDITDLGDLYEESEEWLGAVEEVETIPTEREPGAPNTIHYSKRHGR